MMLNIKRQNAQFSIDENPTTITFNKTTYTLNSLTGAKTKVETTFQEIVRITKNNNSQIILNNDIGKMIKDESFIILSNYLSEIEHTNDIQVDFEYENNKYFITSVMKNKDNGEITSIQSKTEVIK